MGKYFVAAICTSGHCISSAVSSTSKDNYCPICGAPVITKCPECKTSIRGSYDNIYGIAAKYTTPSYCYHCGAPFPWTRAALDSTAEIIRMDEAMDEATQQQLIDALPDIVSETPKTPLAVVRFKRVLTAAGKFTADGIRQFAIDFGCELARKLLFGS